ncbi:FAD-dependent monooxygenase [Nocardia terpenica]|uniref:2,4-dichlorophenol 6-monooxygenase n=1 Tax=Nocardia terpenica TaxID=455432 RepID=A0A6G9Z9H4_9NOCA|nr:FAD-dependent monooxygenase [Nocardia terpenica]QIS22132.1 2,4-dichlorophenol 6-monooxygenase [Nocardia terpenica]
MPSVELEVPVLIVGAGPSGLTASLALSRQGVHHVVVGKHPATAHTPRAHLLNQRTVEILRDLGIEYRVLARAMPTEFLANHVFMTTFSGAEIARLSAYGNGPDRVGDYRAASPCQMCNCPQHVLEPLLVDAIGSAGVADVRFGQEFLRLAQDESGVTAWVMDRQSGQEYSVRSDYVIGADGAGSRVLAEAGLTVEGMTGIAEVASIWFEADLERYSAYRPGILYTSLLPSRMSPIGDVFVCVRPWHEWVFIYGLDPSAPFPEDDHDKLRELIRESIGDRAARIDIKDVSTWSVNSAVAPRFSSGRVFCVGDAVHQNPPTNGLGLNTGVADAFNLAWKIKFVLDGSATPVLLDSYDAERQPVGGQVVERAFQSMLDLAAVPGALGFGGEQTAQDRWQLLWSLDDDTEDARKRRDVLTDARDRINYQANAHGIELGYRYRSGARIADGTTEPAHSKDPQLYYEATTWPGARLPHAWLEQGRRRLSTLDITGRGRFVLLTGQGGDEWYEAARAATRRTGTEITVRSIGTRGGLRDPYGEWERLREVESSGCVLVRPDHHVAWRAATSAGTAELPRVVAELLGMPAEFEPEG